MLEIYGKHRIKCDHPDCDMGINMKGYTNSVARNAYAYGFKLHSDGIHWFCRKHAPDHVCFETVKEAINKSIS